MERPDFRVILRTLTEQQVEFLVVGGVAAVLQGVPVSTFDLDIVHSREDSNLDRLVAALQDLGTYYREKPDLRIAPDRGKLQGAGHHLLLTRAGPLDVLGAVVTGDGYATLRDHSVPVDLGDGLVVRVLDLRTLIAIKERLNREKDRAVLPVLRRTLQEKEKGQN